VEVQEKREADIKEVLKEKADYIAEMSELKELKILRK
jgi:hypothetical protein